MPPSGVRVFLADDHPVVLAGMKALLMADPGLEVVGEAGDGGDALRLAAELRPDIAVLDVSMPGFNCVEIARKLRAACPTCKVVALTGHEDGATLRQLLEIGAVGYVLKRSAAEDLLTALRTVAAGRVYVDPAIAGGGVGQSHKPADVAAVPDLSEREVGVLRLTAAGHSNKTIAARLQIGVKTVETYKARAMAKLGFRSRVEVVRYAFGKGWLAEA